MGGAPGGETYASRGRWSGFAGKQASSWSTPFCPADSRVRRAAVKVAERYHHISSIIYYSPTAPVKSSEKKSGGWFSRLFGGGQTAEEAPTNMRAPVCLDESGRDPYGKDVFGTYDLNGRKKAEEKDVDQLIADHSIFPKALAYNVDDSEDVYPPRE